MPLYAQFSANASQCTGLATGYMGRGGLSDQKIEKGTFLRIEKLSFWEPAVEIRDVAGIPSPYLGELKNSALGQFGEIFLGGG